MSNRYGKDLKKLPHCLRQLPENQPRNRQEYLLRKAIHPDDQDMYFDNEGHFLYDTKCMSQELERLKMARLGALRLVQSHAQFLKSIIMNEKTKPPLDIASMRARYRRAQEKASKSLLATSTGSAATPERTPDKPGTSTATSAKPQLRRSTSCTSVLSSDV